MPIYEYRRQDGSTFELMQSITADALTQDPETGEPVQRVLHAPAVHFKGSGFYNTDYGTKKRQRETKESAEKSADKTESKASEKKSDSSSSSKNGSSSSSGSTTTSSSSSSSKKD